MWIECTSRREDDYHPHIHAVVKGKEAAEALLEAWLKFAPKWTGQKVERRGQDVSECGEGALIELFKYFTKLSSDGHRIPVRRLDVIFTAMKGRRVFQPCGFTLSEEEDLEEIELDESTAAISQLGRDVLWSWDQEVADWIDGETGECLTGHSPVDDHQSYKSTSSTGAQSWGAEKPKPYQMTTAIGLSGCVPLNDLEGRTDGLDNQIVLSTIES